jgi:hypothetical protein
MGDKRLSRIKREIDKVFERMSRYKVLNHDTYVYLLGFHNGVNYVHGLPLETNKEILNYIEKITGVQP